MCDEVIESCDDETKTIPKTFNGKKATCFNDIINKKRFDSDNIKVDKKSYKHIFIYYNGHVTIEDSKFVITLMVQRFN